MGPLVVSCRVFEIPEPPPSIRLPMGMLQSTFSSLDRIPTAGQLLGKLLERLDLALMPVKQLLELIEIVMAFKNCFQAIPDAITQLSPSPVFDCIKNMLKAFARLMSYIPPLSYARTVRDVCRFFVSLIDEVIRLFQRIDLLVAGYVDTIMSAQLAGDLELVQFANCGMANLKISMKTLFDIMRLIQPVTDILMVSIMRLIPNPTIRKEVEKAASASSYMDQAVSSLVGGTVMSAFNGVQAGAQNPLVPLPKIAPVLQAISILRNMMVVVHNILSPIVGSDADLEVAGVPSFQYL